MKVKDLMGFNPEAEIALLGLDYTEISLDLYGWATVGDCDCNEDTDTKTTTPCIHLIPKGFDDKFTPEHEA